MSTGEAVPEPPAAFLAATEALPAGHRLYRVHSNVRTVARAVVVFGDRCADAIRRDPSFGRIFQSGPGLDWLIETCGPLRVDVLPPAAH